MTELQYIPEQCGVTEKWKPMKISLHLRNGLTIECEKVEFSRYAHTFDIYQDGRYTQSLPATELKQVSCIETRVEENSH